jgi:hypothetical protein
VTPHVVLLGDSIFDNARYVPGGPPVVEQVRAALPAGGRATLLAQDGATTEDVPRQLAGLPADATHLVLSVGGNDALSEAALLREPAVTVGEALGLMDEVLTRFEAAYRGTLRAVGGAGRPTAVCTVYDRVPGLTPADRTALRGFNEAILRAAAEAELPVIDLRLVCDAAGDYSAVSPIEPSVPGGAKIAARVAAVVAGHDFAAGRCVVYR